MKKIGTDVPLCFFYRNFLPTLDLLLKLSLKTYFALFVLCICLFSHVQSSPAREKKLALTYLSFFSRLMLYEEAK